MRVALNGKRDCPRRIQPPRISRIVGGKWLSSSRRLAEGSARTADSLSPQKRQPLITCVISEISGLLLLSGAFSGSPGRSAQIISFSFCFNVLISWPLLPVGHPDGRSCPPGKGPKNGAGGYGHGCPPGKWRAPGRGAGTTRPILPIHVSGRPAGWWSRRPSTAAPKSPRPQSRSCGLPLKREEILAGFHHSITHMKAWVCSMRGHGLSGWRTLSAAMCPERLAFQWVCTNCHYY